MADSSTTPPTGTPFSSSCTHIPPTLTGACKLHAEASKTSIPIRTPRHLPGHRPHPQSSPPIHQHPLTQIIQVVVASIITSTVKVPDDKSLLYETADEECNIKGSRKLKHTEKFRFFDKAAVETEADRVKNSADPWQLCTVTQVEELKSIIVYCRTIRPCSLWLFFCLPILLQSGEFPFQENELDALTSRMPGMEGVLRRRDLPSFCRRGDLDDPNIRLYMTGDIKFLELTASYSTHLKTYSLRYTLSAQISLSPWPIITIRMIDIAVNFTDNMFRGIYNGKQCHIPDIAAVLTRAWSAGVDRIIVTDGSLEESKEALAIAETDARLFCTVGVHPTRCKEFDESGDPEKHFQELLSVENVKKYTCSTSSLSRLNHRGT
ncbi:unnamed protein product [Camellia sinensis]